MNHTDRKPGLDSLSPVMLLLPPLGATALLWGFSTTPLQTFAGFCAFLLLAAPWGSYLLWLRQNRGGIPLFAMISGMYWVYFVPTLFTGTRSMPLARPIIVDEESVTIVMGMVVLGVLSLWAGMRMPFNAWRPEFLPYIPETQKNLAYLRFVVLAGAASAFFPQSVYLLGGDARQVMIILESAIPSVAFIYLLQRYWNGVALPADKLILIIYVASRAVSGLGSGWLGPLVGLGLTVITLYTFQNRSVPWKYIALTVGLLLFFQVGKTAYRDAFWERETDATLAQRVTFWVNASASQWFDSERSSDTGTGELASQTLERASLLVQVAHVIEITPSMVPFQYGSTYSYMAVTWIPRFLWPEKPSMSDANRFYQIAYGLSDRHTVQSTSISVGCLAEAYINFGWYGVIAIMFLVGVLLGVFERTFFTEGANGYFLAMGLALMPVFLSIESQFAQYFSGVVQQFFLMLLAFLPIAKRRMAGSPSQLRWTAQPRVPSGTLRDLR